MYILTSKIKVSSVISYCELARWELILLLDVIIAVTLVTSLVRSESKKQMDIALKLFIFNSNDNVIWVNLGIDQGFETQRIAFINTTK